MYQCEACEHVFEEARVKVIKAPYSGERFREPDDVEVKCPMCGSEDIEEVRQCKTCGRWHAGCDDLCDVCIREYELKAARYNREKAERDAAFIADTAKGNEYAERFLREIVA